MNKIETDRYLRTDERVELVSLCEFVASYARLEVLELQEWRWLIIGSAMALQGACVCALSGYDTTSTATLQDNFRQAELKRLHDPKSPAKTGDEKLADPVALLKRVRKESELPVEYRAKFGDDVLVDCKRLIELRNEFIHFLPMGWSLQAAGLPRIIDNSWSVIEQLAVLKPTFSHQITDAQKRSLGSSVTEIRGAMQALGIIQ